jgi:hypothetical protein
MEDDLFQALHGLGIGFGFSDADMQGRSSSIKSQLWR